MYNGVPGPALKGRSNVPFDSAVMGGFIDTINSQLNETIIADYTHKREQDKIDAKMMTAAAKREMAPDRGNWDHKFRMERFMASLAGVAIRKNYVVGAPKFKTDIEIVDYLDFIPDPTGGPDLDKHIYKFQTNIFRTWEDLFQGFQNGFYDKSQIYKLKTNYTEENFKKAQDEYMNKASRFYNLDVTLKMFTGQKMYRMCEGVTFSKGKWWYIFFNPDTRIWVRCVPLTEAFDIAKDYEGRGPWDAWHTNPHPFLFWSKAPAHDIRPIAYTMKKAVNYMLDNLEKVNWDMKAIDPKIFPDPSKLRWRQNGVVVARRKSGVEDISKGIYQFQTPDTVGVTINLIEWLNNFTGTKVGASPEAEGQASTDRVGIAFANLQQTTKRLSLENDYFKNSVVRSLQFLDYGMYEHLREKYAVKIIGNAGIRWEEEITRKTTEKEFTIAVRASNDDQRRSLIQQERREKMLDKLSKFPDLLSKVNKNWLVRDLLETDGGVTDEELQVALDVNNDADEDSLSRAAEAIEQCINGEELYDLYGGATPAFVQKIIDFCNKNFDLMPKEKLSTLSRGELKRYNASMEKHDKLMTYALQHIPIVVKNTQRKAEAYIAMAPQPEQPAATPARGPETPPNTPLG